MDNIKIEQIRKRMRENSKNLSIYDKSEYYKW